MTQPLEGNGFSKLNQLFMQGVDAANTPAKIQLATVTQDAPDITIKLDADGRELDKDFIIVSERLTKHKRIMTIRKRTDERFADFTSQMRFKSMSVNDSMSPAGEGPHTHDVTMVEMSDVQNDFDMIELEVEYNDELQVGDRILVACLDVDMTYIILDRAVFYK